MTARRYPLVGGLAVWRLPLLATASAACALSTGEWEVAAAIGLVAVALRGLDRGLTLESSPAGLARGFVFDGKFLGPSRTVPWGAIVEVRTAWRGPRDYSGLVTTVTARDGATIRFTSRMGLVAYRALLEDIAGRAPGARRCGLTAEVMLEALPPWLTHRRERA
jgi:hypothetical protein